MSHTDTKTYMCKNGQNALTVIILVLRADTNHELQKQKHHYITLKSNHTKKLKV